MKKLHHLTLMTVMLFATGFSRAQFFKEDFSRVKINNGTASNHEWENGSGSMLCNGGSWEISTDNGYIYGNGGNTFSDLFSYSGSVNGFAKLSHWCDEGSSSVHLRTPLIWVGGQAQVMLEFVSEFAGGGFTSAQIGVGYGPGNGAVVTGVSSSLNADTNVIDITSFVAGHSFVYIYFSFYYLGQVGSSYPVTSSWCVDDVKLYNPQCNIQAVIKANAASNYVCVGDSVELVRDNPTGGTSFQWMQNGTNILGATNANYYATQKGVYSCYITDTCGYVYSNNLVIDTVSVLAPVLTNALTFDSVFCTGLYIYNGGFFISPNAVSNTYQWYNNGASLTGSTHNNLDISTYGAGNYYVEVSNACGVYNSDTIQVAAGTPTTAVITTGSPFPACYPNQFMLVAYDSTGFVHEWYRGNFTTGITNDTLLFYPSVYGFKCKVQAPGRCPTFSNIITVPVSPLNNIANVTVIPGGATTFCVGDSVMLSTPFMAGVSYQWKKNGVNITSATQAGYIAKTAGSYSVQAYDTICDRISNNIQVLTPCAFLSPDVSRLSIEKPKSTMSDSRVHDLRGLLVCRFAGDVTLEEIYEKLNTAPGVYILSFKRDGLLITTKLVITTNQ